ncbi:MAG: D-aminoacylase [Acidiferrobacterales bacterium]|nr:D-aminoacylase [Acidiferrobacterales bacterium]
MAVDLKISGGRVIDGTGGESRIADVVVDKGRITGVGEFPDTAAIRLLDAQGKCVAPGFIDAHTHDDRVLLSSPDMSCKISQGVTTVVTGNCGVSLAPLANVDPPPPLNLLGDRQWYRFGTTAAYVSELRNEPAAVNSMMLVGHSTLRVSTMDRLDRPATAKEIVQMERLVDAAMQEGASGFSTGLEYPPSIQASEKEVIALAKRASMAGGIYTTHMRNESDDVHLSIGETVRVAREADISTVISHHKTCGKNNFGRTCETLPQIEAAKKSVQLNFDVYPYVASSTSLLPQYLSKADRVLITWSDPHPECSGMELEKICENWNVSTAEAVDLLSPAGAIYFQMDEEDLQRVLKFPGAMIGSDGLPSDRFPHPRLWGTFPRVLGHYSRDLGLFSLEEAVARMTGNTSDTFGIADRGFISKGMCADIVVFDPETVIDRASFEDPLQPAAGIEWVFVNGELVYEDCQWTGSRPGMLLSRAA